jgi:hypothetical protein
MEPASMGTQSSATPRARVHGVSEALPPGESIRWEGAPNARAITRHLLFVRPLAGYFAVVIGWWMFANRGEIATATFWTTVGVQLALVLMVLGGIVSLGRWIASSTTYAITDRRLVIRLGIIFPLTVNVPLHYVTGAKVKSFADGTGQIALQLESDEKLAWIVLFPHVRPWTFSNPEPLLRGLEDPRAVGAILGAAVLAVPAATARAVATTAP